MRWTVTDEGGHADITRLKEHELRLPPGSIAEIVFEPSGSWNNSIRQRLADRIDMKVQQSGRKPWANRRQVASYSWIDQTITVRWTVPGSNNAEFDSNFETGIATATVVAIIIGAILAVLGINYMIKLWRFRAGEGPPPPTFAGTVTKIGFAGVVVGLIYYTWIRYALRPPNR